MKVEDTGLKFALAAIVREDQAGANRMRDLDKQMRDLKRQIAFVQTAKADLLKLAGAPSTATINADDFNQDHRNPIILGGTENE